MIRFIQAAHNENGAAFPKPTIGEISHATGLPDILSGVLFGRGIKTAAEAKAFLSCGLESLHDPFLLKNMDKAVERIRAALDRNERIMVYGDYDCDGLTAAAMLIRHFKKLGADIDHYIPKRYDEGYGLNMQAMETIAKSGCRLLVTVDCGITAIKEAGHACSLGVDVIITDHHQCLKELPQCYAVINPKQPDDSYPFKELSGAGIAAKLIQALSGIVELEEYLDLAALGTIADIVPLLGENRIIAARGIDRIRKGGNTGLSALMDAAGIEKQTADSWHISFALAPRINACGRMGDPIKALELLITDDPAAAELAAAHLDKENRRRQEEGTTILSQALEMIAGNDMVDDRAIILCGKGWSQGVVGIVAAKLVEIFYRPVILLCEENGICTGSGRSIPGIHMFETLERFSHLFIRFGGHEMAGGLTLSKDNVSSFASGYQALLSAYDASLFIPVYEYDVPARINQIDARLADEINRLGPFGEGNENPVFLLEDVQMDKPGIFGKQKDHLKATIMQEKDSMEGILWRGSEQLGGLKGFSRFHMIVSPSVEDWNGRRVRCIIKAYHPSLRADDFRNNNPARSEQYQDAMISQLIYNADTDALETNGRNIETLDRAEMDELVRDRLGSGVQGTLVAASTPAGSAKLAELIETYGLWDKADYFFCKPEWTPCPYNAVWFAPCSKAERTGFRDILLYDGCFGTGFINLLIQSMPRARLHISMDTADTDQMAAEAGRYRFSRETLLQCFSALKSIAGKAPAFKSLAALLERLRSVAAPEMDMMQLRIAMRIFSELELMVLNEDNGLTIRMLEAAGKKDLHQSRTFSALERAQEDILNMGQYAKDRS